MERGTEEAPRSFGAVEVEPAYAVADGFHACLVGEVPVLLDEYNGRYLRLRGPTALSLAAFLADRASPADCDNLLQRGLLAKSATRQSHQVATFSYSGDRKTRIPWTLLLQSLLLEFSARIHVKRHSFPEIIRLVRQNRTRQRHARFVQRSHFSEEEIARVFHFLQRILPSRSACLPRSLAIRMLLHRYGHQPVMVIGVQLPIAAHCWIQCEGRVIGDTLDRITSFEPILAL